MESRTRVFLHLVCNARPEDMRACNQVLDHLQSQRRSHPRILGFTSSALRHPSVFQGWWWSSTKSWANDEVLLVVIDYEHKDGRFDPALVSALAALRRRILAIYKECGHPQEEVWIVSHDVLRFNDPVPESDRPVTKPVKRRSKPKRRTHVAASR